MAPSASPVDVLTAQADLRPDKAAVVDEATGTSLTYAELEARSNRLANVLIDAGVTVGTRVVWCGQNSTGVVSFVHAARKIGATAVPLNYRLSDEETAYVVDHSDATVVYVDAELAPRFERIRHRIPQVSSVLVFGDVPSSRSVPDGMIAVDALADQAAGSIPGRPVGAEPGATMIYTSGTTGRPKGVVKQSSTRPDQSRALLDLIGYSADDVYLTTGPLYHSGPGAFMGIAHTLGQTVVIQRKFDAEDWLRLVHTYRCTTTFAAPTPIRMVTNLPVEVKARYDRSSMRIMIANAAPWSLALKQRYLEDFPEDSLFEVYGSTELGVNTVLLPEDQLRKPGSCGRPAPMVDIRLYADDGSLISGTGPESTGPDAAGEVYVRGASVFSHYHKQSGDVVTEDADGFRSVGDVAYRDPEGFLYICDRKTDMIISGGMNVYPAEIESVLESHPGVVEAAVFGIPDEQWGERVHAAVVAQPGADLSREAVVAHAREHLAGYKVPRSVSFVDELPKTGSGKVLKRELRLPFWAGRDSNVS